MPNRENRGEAARGGRLRRILAAAVAVCLVAGGSDAKPLARATVIDARYQTPYGTILRGHAGNAGGIAELLEDLGRPPGTEEPILREMSRSGRGYEFMIVVPFGPDSEEDTPRRPGSPEPPRTRLLG